MASFDLVDNDGNVTVPEYWLALSPGEEIVAAVGQFYKPSCFEIVMSILTLGYVYVRFVRSKLMERSGMVHCRVFQFFFQSLFIQFGCLYLWV